MLRTQKAKTNQSQIIKFNCAQANHQAQAAQAKMLASTARRPRGSY
jgi:hypothetical protein